MKFLFFFVHPSKFYVFRNAINQLKLANHRVDILITSKDVLEILVKNEGWSYTNIFPEGRKINGMHPILSSGVNFFRTIYRLFKYTKNRKYDLFITDDLLVYLSAIRRTPSIAFTDDDLHITKLFSLVLSKATHILAPNITDLGRFNSKKLGFEGYKELAYLHPNCFNPDISVVKEFNPELDNYYIIRLVSLRAYHDVGKKGLTNEQVLALILLLEKKGKVFISAERELPEMLKKYRLNIQPEKIAHALYYADLFIGDSQTMTSEAAVLGTPAFRCNDFAGKISVMDEKEEKYGLSFSFTPNEYDSMIQKINEVLGIDDFKSEFQKRRLRMLEEKIDLSSYLLWLFQNYPESIKH